MDIGRAQVAAITGEETGARVALTETLSTTGDETGIEIEIEPAEDALDDVATYEVVNPLVVAVALIETTSEEETVADDLATEASTGTEDETVAEVVARTAFAVAEVSVVVEATAAAVLP